jgi:hypothetical protein
VSWPAMSHSFVPLRSNFYTVTVLGSGMGQYFGSSRSGSCRTGGSVMMILTPMSSATRATSVVSSGASAIACKVGSASIPAVAFQPAEETRTTSFAAAERTVKKSVSQTAETVTITTVITTTASRGAVGSGAGNREARAGATSAAVVTTVVAVASVAANRSVTARNARFGSVAKTVPKACSTTGIATRRASGVTTSIATSVTSGVATVVAPATEQRTTAAKQSTATAEQICSTAASVTAASVTAASVKTTVAGWLQSASSGETATVEQIATTAEHVSAATKEAAAFPARSATGIATGGTATAAGTVADVAIVVGDIAAVATRCATVTGIAELIIAANRWVGELSRSYLTDNSVIHRNSNST